MLYVLSNTQPMQPPLPRRIKAAMELAGYESADALAQAIDEYGLGASTLRKFLREERVPRRLELQTIADACGVPYEFFTAPDPWAGWKHTPAGTAKVDAILAQVEVNARVLEAVVRALRSQGADVPDEIAAEVSATRRGFERANEALDAAHRELRADPPSTETPAGAR